MSTFVLSQGAKLMAAYIDLGDSAFESVPSNNDPDIWKYELDDRAGNEDLFTFYALANPDSSCISDLSMIGKYVLKIPITGYKVLETYTTDPTNFVSSLTRSLLGRLHLAPLFRTLGGRLRRSRFRQGTQLQF